MKFLPSFRFSVAAAFSVVAGVAAVFYGCGGTREYSPYTYAGPNDAYAVLLNTDGSFSFTHAPDALSTTDLNVTGTFSRLDSGFVQLTVAAVEGAGGPSIGAQTYAIEIPGFVLALKPFEDDRHLLPMIISGTCPANDYAANWIALEKTELADAQSPAHDYFGTFEYLKGSNTASYPLTHALEGPFTSLGSGPLATLSTCSRGFLGFTNGGLWVSAAGGMIVHRGNDVTTTDDILLGIPQSTVAGTNALVEEYSGIVFDKGLVAGDPNRIYPVSADVSSTGLTTMTLVGRRLSDVSATPTGPGTFTITFTAIDNPAPGFVSGTIDQGGNQENISCVTGTNVHSAGKNAIFCVAASPQDGSQMINLLFTSK